MCTVINDAWPPRTINYVPRGKYTGDIYPAGSPSHNGDVHVEGMRTRVARAQVLNIEAYYSSRINWSCTMWNVGGRWSKEKRCVFIFLHSILSTKGENSAFEYSTCLAHSLGKFLPENSICEFHFWSEYKN